MSSVPDMRVKSYYIINDESNQKYLNSQLK